MRWRTGCFFLALVWQVPVGYAQDSQGSTFLRVEGVPGDSEDADHREWIDVVSFQLSAATDGAAAVDPVFSNLTVLAQTDRAALAMLGQLASDTLIGQVKLERTELFGNGKQEVVEEWDLQNAAVSAFLRNGTDTIEYRFAYEQGEFCFSDRRDDGSLWSRKCADFGPSPPQATPPIPESEEESDLVPLPQGSVLLRISGVEGQSEEPHHQGWIDAEAFAIGVLRLPGDGAFLGEIAASDLIVATPFDVTTRAVFEKFAQNETIEEVELELIAATADGDALDVEQWNLQNAHVTRVVRDSDQPAQYAMNAERIELCQIQRNQNGFNLSKECKSFDTQAAGPQLQAGDADQDLDFDQLDLVRVQQAGTYLTSRPATWGDGDWNAAPGGSVGSPPTGDGRFNQLDIVAAQQAGLYLTGPYAAIERGRLAHVDLIQAPVPEPSTLVMSLLALISFAAWRPARGSGQTAV